MLPMCVDLIFLCLICLFNVKFTEIGVAWGRSGKGVGEEGGGDGGHGGVE